MNTYLESMLECVVLPLTMLVLVVAACTLLWKAGVYISSGGLGEPCYSDQTCEGNLVCAKCQRDCVVTFRCVPR